MECKRCVECSDSGNEEQMMFCDRCDRGYHVFCVGLKKIPQGNWDCPLCAPQATRSKRRGSSTISRRRAGENHRKRPRKTRKRGISVAYDDSNDEDSVQRKLPEITSSNGNDPKQNTGAISEDGDRVAVPEQEVQSKARPRRKQRSRMIIDDGLLTTSSDEASLTQGSLDSARLAIRRKQGDINIPRRRGRPRKSEQTESDAETTRSSQPSKSSKPRPSRNTKVSYSPPPEEATEDFLTISGPPCEVTESKKETESKRNQPPPSFVGSAGDVSMSETTGKETGEVESVLTSEDSVSSEKVVPI